MTISNYDAYMGNKFGVTSAQIGPGTLKVTRRSLSRARYHCSFAVFACGWRYSKVPQVAFLSSEFLRNRQINWVITTDPNYT